MTIPVDVADLPEALESFGAGYLLTSKDGRVKVYTVEPVVGDGVLTMTPASKGTAANLAANPACTLTFPPLERRGYTLIVDGTARADGDDVVFTPEAAILHRPAIHSGGPPAPGKYKTVR